MSFNNEQLEKLANATHKATAESVPSSMNDYIVDMDALLQVLDYHGLALNQYTRPTDIDVFFSIKGGGYVIGEIKRKGVRLPRKQYAVFMHLVDLIHSTGVPCFLIVGEHDIPKDQPVDVAQCKTRFYYDGNGEKNGTIFPEEPETFGETFRRLIAPYYPNLETAAGQTGTNHRP